jgi:hypothetical protein
VDEVRIEISFSANMDVAGHIRTRTTMKLYEGASCFSNDLDGGPELMRDGAGDPPTVTPDAAFRVNNTEEYTPAEIVAMDCDFAILTQRLQVS